MRRLLVVLLGLLLASLPSMGTAHEYVVDQSCVGDLSTSNDAWTFSPMGQSFVPSFDRVDVVELYLRDHAHHHTVPVFAVHVRADSMTGPILGTTAPVTPPAYHEGPVGFEFTESVPLSPGSTYVLEFALLENGYGWFLCHTHADYPFGGSFVWGEPTPYSDLWFREGAYDWVPVQATTWGRVKALMMAGPSN